MHTLSQKTTILFSPELYRQLKDIALATQTSVGELIRRAVIREYMLSDKKKRLEAVKHLSQIGGNSRSGKRWKKRLLKDISKAGG